MATAPPGPVYPVMVIAPLLVVKVNWACATTASAKTSSSGRSRLKDVPILEERNNLNRPARFDNHILALGPDLIV